MIFDVSLTLNKGDRLDEPLPCNIRMLVEIGDDIPPGDDHEHAKRMALELLSSYLDTQTSVTDVMPMIVEVHR